MNDRAARSADLTLLNPLSLKFRAGAFFALQKFRDPRPLVTMTVTPSHPPSPFISFAKVGGRCGTDYFINFGYR